MSDNWRSSEYREWLQARLIYARPDSVPSPQEVAQRMGRSPNWVYAVLQGDIAPSPEDLVGLVNATGDREILAWMVNRCEGYSLVELPVADGLDGDFLDELSVVLEEVAELVRKRGAVLRDKRIDSRELQDLLASTGRAVGMLLAAETEIKGRVG